MKMELKVVDEKKNSIVLEVIGEDHTLCNALKAELRNDNSVKVASYNISHPLIKVPALVVETDGADPKTVIVNAAKKLGKTIDKFKDVSKNIK